jgi:2-keto-4-pentenoate hydratase/2-oxohepta-3-ene-1,7-dioic acid hydratase in catechol pathway
LAEIGAGPFEIVTRVNSEERQRDSTARMTFSFARIVEYVSTFCTLMPGDIILTGTPAGAGARLEPPVWLKPGDQIEVESPLIGTLANGVRGDESDLGPLNDHAAGDFDPLGVDPAEVIRQ